MREYSTKAAADIFGENNKPSNFDERKLASDDIDSRFKSDADFHSDELEEYTPEECSKAFEAHSKGTNWSDEDTSFKNNRINRPYSAAPNHRYFADVISLQPKPHLEHQSLPQSPQQPSRSLLGIPEQLRRC